MTDADKARIPEHIQATYRTMLGLDAKEDLPAKLIATHAGISLLLSRTQMSGRHNIQDRECAFVIASAGLLPKPKKAPEPELVAADAEK